MIILAGGITGLLDPTIRLGATSYVGAFSLQQFGQPFRSFKVAKLTNLLNPVGKIAARLRYVGGFAELVGTGYIGYTTHNWAPFAVSGIGLGLGVAIGATLGLPAMVGFSVAYVAADYFGAFDPSTYR